MCRGRCSVGGVGGVVGGGVGGVVGGVGGVVGGGVGGVGGVVGGGVGGVVGGVGGVVGGGVLCINKGIWKNQHKYESIFLKSKLYSIDLFRIPCLLSRGPGPVIRYRKTMK